MIRLLRTAILFPIALVVTHFLGYAYAYLAAGSPDRSGPLTVAFRPEEPLLPHYAGYLADIGTQGLGLLPGSSAGTPIIAAIGQATLASAGLLGLAFLLSSILGVSLGLLAVRDQPPRISPWLAGLTALGLATPSFFFGVLGISLVVIILIYAPGRPVLLPLEGFGWDRHLVLPTIALMLRPTAQIAQVTAATMVAELERPYVLTARSIGQREPRIRRRHVLRNALTPISGAIAGSLRYSAGELIIVESLFYWPGLGYLLAQTLIPSNLSIGGETALFLNPPVLAATLVPFAALFLASSLLNQALAAWIDPRLKR